MMATYFHKINILNYWGFFVRQGFYCSISIYFNVIVKNAEFLTFIGRIPPKSGYKYLNVVNPINLLCKASRGTEPDRLFYDKDVIISFYTSQIFISKVHQKHLAKTILRLIVLAKICGDFCFSLTVKKLLVVCFIYKCVPLTTRENVFILLSKSPKEQTKRK